MNDPWDVKSVRQAGQYVSCMKINGVPLLPPVLSKECHKEMQYYKLLAKEVEKRITHLKSYVIDMNDTESSEDQTEAPELPECEQSYELPQEEIDACFNDNIDKITAAVTNEVLVAKSNGSSHSYSVTTDYYKNVTASNSNGTPTVTNSPKKIVIDLSLNINEIGRNVLQTNKINTHCTSPSVDLPERDYDCNKKTTEKEILIDLHSSTKTNRPRTLTGDIVNFSYSVDKDILSDPYPDLSINQDGPSSLSSKSFTGSLIDIYTESMKDSQTTPKLIRQRSYTLLKPSPQLLAHLEVQSLNTGIDMSCISMSESLSNLSSPGKKRRSWDLETAKVKWSSMALELNQKNIPNSKNINSTFKNFVGKLTPKTLQSTSPQRSRSVLQNKSRSAGGVTKALPKSEPIEKHVKRSLSPVRNVSNRKITKETTLPKTATSKKDTATPKHGSQLISESDDPALRVRELYEKIQKQQLAQMSNLVEKQKREQLLLQQVFEEQNNLLCKQLKTICPKAPIEVKEAWGDKNKVCADRGPVSLSQLINHKAQEQRECDSPVSTTLTETNNYINHCDDILKRSKDITESLKKQPSNYVTNQNGSTNSSPKPKFEGNRTRTHSPSSRTASRRLNYDTSASSDRDYDPMLTNRTNDTMADLNVTFPTDQSDDGNSEKLDKTVIKQCNTEVTLVHRNPVATSSRVQCAAARSRAACGARVHEPWHQASATFVCQPTPQQRLAASRIVAGARGFLVRRLMRTDRVRATVQTIRDALLCALQLHQERDGIRGADVDLHRRLIQQITAACYALHDTFIASSPAERCAIIAADRARRHSPAPRRPAPTSRISSQGIMSQSHSGAFPARSRQPCSATLMTQSNYETFSGEKCGAGSGRNPPSPRRGRCPWR